MNDPELERRAILGGIKLNLDWIIEHADELSIIYPSFLHTIPEYISLLSNNPEKPLDKRV